MEDILKLIKEINNNNENNNKNNNKKELDNCK